MPKSFGAFPPHPLAFGSNSGAYDMKAGDILQHNSGRQCRADEFLHDGDAFVTWEDGTYGEAKWNQLRPLENHS